MTRPPLPVQGQQGPNAPWADLLNDAIWDVSDRTDGKVGKGELVFNVKDYGAKGVGGDDTAPIQAALDAAMVTGGAVFFPPGKYSITTTLTVDIRGITGLTTGTQRRVDIVGSGRGNTLVRATTDGITILKMIGQSPLGTDSNGLGTIRDICFGGQTPTPRTATGLQLQDLAFMTVERCSFIGLQLGMRLTGCLSSKFATLFINNNTNGVLAEPGASACNSNTWVDCEFGSLTGIGYDGLDRISNGTFLNCRFEGCGTTGVSAPAFRQYTSGGGGEVGLNFIGCYIERNRGSADFYFEGTGAQREQFSFIGCNFNRASSTDFVTNCIATTGNIDLSLLNCAFTSYSPYVADASRPYLNLSPSTRFRDLGNRFEDALERPRTPQSLPYAGKVDGSAGTAVGAAAVLPPGWTVAQSSVGTFVITHNLNTTNYVVVATTNTGLQRQVQRVVISANGFTVRTVDTASAGQDTDFTFTMQLV